MSEKTGSLTRRDSLQLMLGVTALGLALGKKTADAKEASFKIKLESLSATEKSTFIKLTKTEQSLFLKLDKSERSQFIKLTGDTEKSEFLKHSAED